MSSSRKRPHCTKCGSPMAGHKRSGGVPICIDKDSIVTPPSPPSSRESSPTPEPSQRGRRTIANWASQQFAKIENLPGGYETLPGGWKLRRNPNWVDGPRETIFDDAGNFDMRSDYHGSLVPTELVSSNGEGIGGMDDDTLSVSSGSSDYFVNNVLGNSEAVATVFNSPRDEMDRIRIHAERRGLHTGMLHRPIHGGNPLQRENSWWMVLGENQEVVGHVLDMQDRTLPGFVGMGAYPPKLMPFVPFAVAGAVGGLVVCAGLAFL